MSSTTLILICFLPYAVASLFSNMFKLQEVDIDNFVPLLEFSAIGKHACLAQSNLHDLPAVKYDSILENCKIGYLKKPAEKTIANPVKVYLDLDNLGKKFNMNT